jgi:hypothetical protein
LHYLPVDLNTQFSKAAGAPAQLSILAHIDTGHLHFSRSEGKNLNQLTVVSALFDFNGRFISAAQKVVDMKVQDQTLTNELNHGLTLRTNFDVQPGAYLVRLVVRDSGGQISAENRSVEIP